MALYSVENEGPQVGLGGVPGMELNSYGSSTIRSVQDILDLMRAEKVCVVGHGKREIAKFFWNPEAILSSLSAKRQGLENTCIRSG